jgi:hypothetical protein
MVAVLEEESQRPSGQVMLFLALRTNYELPRLPNEAFEICAMHLEVCPTAAREHEQDKHVLRWLFIHHG